MEKHTREIGVPLWLLKEYLEELGGQAVTETHVNGNGWTARSKRIEDFKIGSLSIGRVRLEIEGDPETLETFLPRLDMKLLRGGG